MQLIFVDGGEALTDDLRDKSWSKYRIEVKDPRSKLTIRTSFSYIKLDEGTRKGLLFCTRDLEPRILDIITSELNRYRCHQLRNSARTMYLERDDRATETVLFAEFKPGELKRSGNTVLKRLDREIQRIKREELRSRRARGIRAHHAVSFAR